MPNSAPNRTMGSTPHSALLLVDVVFLNEISVVMKRKAFSEFRKRHDELFNKFAVLQHESAVFQLAIDTLKAAQRKPKRAKK